MPSMQQSQILQQRIEERENRMKVFESRQYTELVEQLGQVLGQEENLGKYFGPQMPKDVFKEHFNRVHSIFKQSRV